MLYSGRYDSYNTPHVYCLLALGLQWVAIIVDTFHQMKYAKNGEGIVILDVFGTILD